MITFKKQLFYLSIVLTLLSCVKKHENVTPIQSNTTVLNDSVQFIDTTEYSVFWDKFSKSLIQNDTSKLSLLIDHNFSGHCSSNLDISTICRINFTKDSTFTKSRFIKEFYSQLNPVYIELLKKYEVRKDIKPFNTLENPYSRYRCYEFDKDSTYYAIGSSIAQSIRNESASFEFHYNDIESDHGTKGVRLLFRTLNKEMKLFEIDCYYLYEDE